MTLSTTAPHTWCDCRCDRCPLSSGCATTVAPGRGLAAPWPQQGPGVTPDIATLAQAVAAYAGAVDALARSVPGHGYAPLAQKAAQARAGALRLALMAGRVEGLVCPKGALPPHAWVPSVLLMERTFGDVVLLSDQLRCGFPGLSPAGYAGARERLGDALSSWLEAVPARDRALLLHLTERGRAPSPFCQRATSAALDR